MITRKYGCGQAGSAGHAEDRQANELPADLPGQGFAAHVRHDQIGQYQGQDFVRHPSAGIARGQLHPLATWLKTDRHAERAPGRHRIPRAQRQVEEDLLRLGIVEHHRRGLGSDRHDHLNRRRQHRAERWFDRPHQGAQIDDPRRDLHRAAEREELAGQGDPEARRGFDGLKVGGSALGAGHTSQLQVPNNDREQVVEVMDNTAGEPADNLKLLGLHQLGFEPHPFRDIPKIDHDPFDHRVRGEVGRRRLNVEPGPGPANPPLGQNMAIRPKKPTGHPAGPLGMAPASHPGTTSWPASRTRRRHGRAAERTHPTAAAAAQSR